MLTSCECTARYVSRDAPLMPTCLGVSVLVRAKGHTSAVARCTSFPASPDKVVPKGGKVETSRCKPLSESEAVHGPFLFLITEAHANSLDCQLRAMLELRFTPALCRATGARFVGDHAPGVALLSKLVHQACSLGRGGPGRSPRAQFPL